MVSHSERQRLLRDFRHEPALGLGLVFKCAACLLILAGIAAIGIQGELQLAAPIGTHSQSDAKHRVGAPLVVSSKLVEEDGARVDETSVKPVH